MPSKNDIVAEKLYQIHWMAAGHALGSAMFPHFHDT